MKKRILVSLVTILIVVGSVSCSKPAPVASTTPSPSATPTSTPNSTTKDPENTNETYIFIPNDTVEYMVIDTIETDGTAKNLVESLIKSEDKGLGFPEGTELLSLEVKDKTAYVNLNDLYYAPYNYGQTNSDGNYTNQVNAICAGLFYNREFEIDNIFFLREGKETNEIGPLYTEGYNYTEFDYNLILKSNMYRNQ